MLNAQVTKGGNFDVDASVTSPLNKTVYDVARKTSGHFSWNADVTGAYRVCFSNKFSAVTHKVVSFDFRVIRNDATSVTNFADKAAIHGFVSYYMFSLFRPI